MQFSFKQTDSQRYSTTCQRQQPVQQPMLRTHTSTRFGDFKDCPDISPLTVVHNAPSSSPKSWIASSISTYASQLPTTLRLTDYVKEASRHLCSTSASTAMIGETTGEGGYHLPNLPIIQHLRLLIVTHPTEACMPATHAQCISITTINSPLPSLKNG